VVLLHFPPGFLISEKQAARAGGIPLFALGAIITLIAVLSLAGQAQPESSPLGIGLTAIALLIMPGLGWLKRREARRLNNSALAADALQSATCAYLAGTTLIGLALTAAFHIPWFDSAAALFAVALLL
jgi:divalent metal cation (Fe/Co/Zn/Cd) transporter